MPWEQSHRADPRARRVADRHYNRQRPGTPQFVPPGRCCVLYAAGGGDGASPSGEAVWVTSWPFAEYTKHAWAGAWVNSCFRNEGAGLSSDLIRDAIAATRYHYLTTASWSRDPAPSEMVTFVDEAKVAGTHAGYCYKCAGFESAGRTEGGLVALRLRWERMPEPSPPALTQLSLLAG